MALDPLFSSFFLAGFECSTQVWPDGRRLDLLASTGHDRHAAEDYRACRALGLTAARDGLRWHRIETAPGVYDWSSVLPMLKAARETRTQVIWDLLHYGWPNDLDVWEPAFVERFRAFAAAAARVIAAETEGPIAVCPVNEISYFSWAAGEKGHFHPVGLGRGRELKAQLVRAAVAGVEAVRAVDRDARILWAEPVIHVVPGAVSEEEAREALAYSNAQYEALDLLSGRLQPELGGHPDMLDIVGVNFYPHNQWYYNGTTIPMGAANYKPFSTMLGEIHARYGRPLLIAETGSEGSGRAAWLHYVCDEIRLAAEAGVPVGGVCLYPVTAYPGWCNDRPCETGLLSYPDAQGRRRVHRPLADEIARQDELMARTRAEGWCRTG